MIRALFYIVFLGFSLTAFAQEPIELAIGSDAPIINSKNHLGKAYSLESALQDGPVVVVFYRGHWCPYCNKHMSAIQDSLHMITDLGASVIAITPQMSEFVEKTVRKTKASFTIIPDEGHRIMDDWKVTFRMDDKMYKRYKSYGIRVNENAGNEDRALPVPATYIVGKDGKVAGSYFDTDYKGRMPVKDMLKVLEGIKD